MKLLKVIPITKGVSKELFYFSSKDIKEGALVTVPLRNGVIPALVISEEILKKNKTLLRLSPYSLKKILAVKTQRLCLPQFIKAAGKLAGYFLTTTGSAIKELCPQSILTLPPVMNPPKTEEKQVQLPEQNQILLLQAGWKERLKFYKNFIRTEFARGRSVFLCGPTAQKVEECENELKAGIEKFVFSFYSSKSKKEIREKWKKAEEEKHPVLILASGLFLSLPRKDIGSIIIEEEGSSMYKSKYRPFIDIRIAAEKFSEEMNIPLILADEILRIETFHRKNENNVAFAAKNTDKITTAAKENLVDMRSSKTPISSELKEMLEASYRKGEHTLLFINRRGYGLSTVCDDCGRILSCIKCDTPLVLHKKSSNQFICHKCFLRIEAVERCPYCKSWKLQTLGTGIQKAVEEIKKLFPDFKIFQLDSDTVKTKKQGAAVINEYLNTAGGILVATEMLFSYYSGNFDRIGVLSVDGLFNLPDFGINERIFRLLVHLKARAVKSFLIQTRMPEQPLFENLFRGDLTGFYESELSMRKLLGYPPFKTLIKISRESKDKIGIQNEFKLLEQKLKDYQPETFAAFTPKIKDQHRFYMALKLDAGSWPEHQKELSEILSSLPYSFKIEINPESLL